MSNPSSNRWREGRPQSLNTPPPQQQRQQQQQPVQSQVDRAKASASPRPNSLGNAPSQSQSQAPSAAQVPNPMGMSNAWGTGEKSRMAGMTAPGDDKTKRHIAEFNGDEVRLFLRRDVPLESVESKKGISSSLKPGIMANGQDFWVQLRKQVTDLEQSRR